MINPTRGGADLFRSTAAQITAVVMAGLVMLGIIAGITMLAITGHATDGLQNLFQAITGGGVLYTISEIRQLKANTNGQQAKLLDAMIKSPPVGDGNGKG